MNNPLKQVSYIYLLLVPFVTSAIAFGIGHVSYKIYVPVWLVNVCLMTSASWVLGLNVVRTGTTDESKLAKTAFYFIVPLILLSMFAGLGPPPATAAEWVASATEQQIRYFIVAISGVFVVFGYVSLRSILKSKGEDSNSTFAATAMLIAIPLFILNVLYWGFYLTEFFRIQTQSGATHLPDWYLPMRQLFGIISVAEVSLMYFATFSIAVALRKVNWLSKTSGSLYILFSLLAFGIMILSAFLPELNIVADRLSIPAFPFLMPYFIAVNLLRKTGSSTSHNKANNDVR